MSYTDENVDLALQYANAGIYVFPCVGHGDDRKKPCRGIFWKSVASIDESTIRGWWERFPDAVPGLPAERNGKIIIDCDCKGESNGLDWAREHVGGDLDGIPGSDTPGKGRHLIYSNTIGHGDGRGALPAEFKGDIKGKGYVLAPGSRMADGSYYAPRGSIADIVNAPPLSAEWIAFLAASPVAPPVPLAYAIDATRPIISEYCNDLWGRAALRGMEVEIATELEGERNNTVNKVAYRAGRMVAGGLFGYDEARARLFNAAVAGKLPHREASSTVIRALTDGMTKGKPISGATNDTDEPYPFNTTKLVARGLAKQEALARDAEAIDPETGEVQEQKPQISATPFYFRDVKLIPKRQWLYARHLIRKFVSTTIAPGGFGKSSLLIVEALAMATGRPLLGIYPPKRLRVWLWNGEDPLEEIERRLHAARDYFGIPEKETDGWLFVDSGRTSKIAVITQVRAELKLCEPLVYDLKKTIRDKQIDVLIIDPFISSHQVNENDNVAIDRVAKVWTEIADDCNIAIDIAHHSRKTSTGEVTVEDGRGAVALLNAVRSARVLNVMTKEEAAKAKVDMPRASYFKLTTGKMNLAPQSKDQEWYHLRSVWLGNSEGGNLDFGDDVGVVEQWKWPAEIPEEDKFALVAAFIQGGKWKHSDKAADWVGVAVADALNLDIDTTPDKKTVQGLIKLWIKQKRLVVVDRIDEQQRRGKKFVELPGAEDPYVDTTVDAVRGARTPWREGSEDDENPPDDGEVKS